MGNSTTYKTMTEDTTNAVQSKLKKKTNYKVKVIFLRM